MLDLDKFLEDSKNNINEGTSNMKLWDAIDDLKEILGPDEVIDQMCRAMSDDDLEDTLKFIIRMNDLSSRIKI